MSYDMLFPDEVDDPTEVSIGDQDYGDLEHIYVGVDVPTEDNLDEETYLMEPTPAKPTPSAQLATELDATKKPKIYVGRDVALKPDRFSMDVFSLLGSTSTSAGDASGPSFELKKRGPPAASTGASKPDRFSKFEKPEPKKDWVAPSEVQSRQSALVSTMDHKSLRKQRDNTEQDADAETVAYTSSAKVSEVLALSQQRETQSAVEQTGVSRVAAMGVVGVTNNTYVENVGRAVEVKPMGEGLAKGRKRCVCRRFKCVCGFK